MRVSRRGIERERVENKWKGGREENTGKRATGGEFSRYFACFLSIKGNLKRTAVPFSLFHFFVAFGRPN